MPAGRLKLLSEAFDGHGIALAYLFGSQAAIGRDLLHGSQVSPVDRLADLDLGVVTREPLPEGPDKAKLYSGLYNDLVELFSPLDLDLVLLEETHSVFQIDAVKGICIYQDNEKTREQYEMGVLRRAADFGPVLRKFLQEVLEEV